MREHHLIRTPARYGPQVHDTLLRKSLKFQYERKGIKVMKAVVGPGDMSDPSKFESVITIIQFKKPRFIK